MTTGTAIKQTQELLRDKRRDGDFAGQLAIYKELGRLWALQGAYTEAAGNLEKAARVAEYLAMPNETEAIYQSLIAIYEHAGDRDAVIKVYGLLHIHWNLMREVARARQYNEVRLELVAKQIGKPHPSFEERLQYELAFSSKDLDSKRKQYTRLLKGDEAPTVPDEYVEACDFLVKECLIEGQYDDALHYASTCEQAMENPGAWASPEGIESIRNLKQMVEQKRREDS